MIIPIGHEKGVRRRPYVTLAIMALCVALQTYRAFTAPSEADLEALLEERSRLIMQLDVMRYGELDRPAEDEVPPELAEKYPGVPLPMAEELARIDAEMDAFAAKDIALRWGYAPKAEGNDGVLHMLLSIFVHGGWLHLVFNMLFLWLSGSNMEDRWGHLPFAAFYLVGGVIASLSYGLYNPDTEIVVVGASGAIAACMGAFLVAYFHVRIQFVYLWFVAMMPRWGHFHARALYALPIWFGTELLYSWFEANGLQGVAHSAHVGGFAFGAVFALALKHSGVEAKHLMTVEELADDWAGRNPELEEGLQYVRLGNRDGALANFKAVLAKHPDHPTARRELVRLGLDMGQPEVVRPYLSAGLIDLVNDGQLVLLPLLWKQIVAAGLEDAVSDRALAAIVRVGLAHDDAPLAVAALRLMLVHQPKSPLLPGLLWQVADAQEEEGRKDLVGKTLALVCERFPMDPFAERAKQRLARAGA